MTRGSEKYVVKHNCANPTRSKVSNFGSRANEKWQTREKLTKSNSREQLNNRQAREGNETWIKLSLCRFNVES